VFVSFRGSPKRDPRAHSLSAGYVVAVEAASLKGLQVGAVGGGGSGGQAAAGGGTAPQHRAAALPCLAPLLPRRPVPLPCPSPPRPPPRACAQSDDDAGAAKWFPLADAAGGKLRFAFDHGDILKELAAWFESEGKKRGMYVEVETP
jgi:ADP-ribose pyrophosphatase YjhB (NUDIX family)